MHTEQQLREALNVLTARTPATDEVLARLHVPATTASPYRQWRPVLIAATVGLALVVVGAISLPYLTRRTTAEPADRRVVGHWAMISHIDPPPGWSTTSHQISGSYETTTISDATGKAFCSIETDGLGVNPTRPISSSTRPVTVGTQPGLYQETSDLKAPSLTAAVYWHYSPDAWASVSCATGPQGLGGARTSGEVRELLTHLAATVTFGDYPLRLPIKIMQLPPGYSVRSVTQGGSVTSNDWGITLSPAHAGPGTPLVTLTPTTGSVPSANTSVLNYPASFFTYRVGGPMSSAPRTEVSYTQLCIPKAPVAICIAGTNTATDDPESRRTFFHDLATQITYATKPSDLTTWFDATDALPS